MHKHILALSGLMASFLLFGCGEKTASTTEQTEAFQPTPAVTPVPHNQGETVHAPGANTVEKTGGNPAVNSPAAPTPHGDGRAPEPSGQFK